MVKIIKRNGSKEDFNPDKIRKAIRKSADRVCVTIPEKDENKLVNSIKRKMENQLVDIPVNTIHNMVETELDNINQPRVSKSYREYRDNRAEFSSMLDRVYSKKLSLNFIGDRSNANADSALVTTQKAIVYNELNSELYKKFFLTNGEVSAMEDGYIYIHDRGSRLDSMNCCIYDMKSLLEGGFFMGNLDYSEPKTLAVAFDLIGDVTMNAAASQYGGFTIPQVDKLLAKYAEKSYIQYYADYLNIAGSMECDKSKADKYAERKVRRDFEQGFQSWEMKFNSVASSRGDYPFTAITFGLGTGRWETMASSVAMQVRKGGQGKIGFKHPVLFPKLSFFYDEELHGDGKELEWLFDEALDCSMKTMYPDFISLSGDGYAPSMYRKYGTAISRMGCIDALETIEIKRHPSEKKAKTVGIGELFSKANETRGFNYINGKVYDMLSTIEDPEDRNRFRRSGFVFLDSELFSQWAKDFFNKKGRKPTDGDVRAEFGIGLSYWCNSYTGKYALDSKLFDLCSSYHEMRIVDFLVENGYLNSYNLKSRMECTFDRDVVIYGKEEFGHAKAKRLPIYVPSAKVGIVVSSSESDSREKVEFFKQAGTEVISLSTEEIERGDLSKLAERLGIKILEKEHTITEIHTKDVDYVDLELLGVYRWVKDIDGTFVRIKKLLRNKGATNWVSISFDEGKPVLVTEDHPFITENGQVLASELSVGDHLVSESGKNLHISEIKLINRTEDSYDIETETGTFVFSGIRSHNCRAQTSPWFKRGGMRPADENDTPVYDGRFNMGAISLHFSMIAAKARKENREFFDVLHEYLELVRGIHKRTFEYLSHKKAGTNPLGFCQGGFYGGHMQPDDELGEDFLRPMTISFGIIGLNEASVYCTGKAIHEDNSWAISVLKYINEYVEKIKEEDNILYAIYGTPGESLVGTQVNQFKKKYGIVKGVSDREYVTNSFHCHVAADITPIEKQDIEYPMFHLCNGGNIAYARMRSNYNFDAFKAITKRAMKLGFYWGNNQQLDYCEKCGHQFIDSDSCPSCGSTDIVRIERMCGYLGLAKIKGRTMYSDHKMKEFEERISM